MPAPKKNAAHPALAGETTLDLTGDGLTFRFLLRPAKLKTNYRESSGGTTYASPAKRSEDAWFVLSKSGMYLGVLSEGSGPEPWAVQQLATKAPAVVADARLHNAIRTGRTWQEAIANSWWVQG